MSLPHINSSLDLTGASIRDGDCTDDGMMHPAPSIELPNQDAQCVSHIALDIGGSLIKLVYFSPEFSEDGSSSPEPSCSGDLDATATATSSSTGMRGRHNSSVHQLAIGNSRGGRLHFVKFETSRVEDAIAFIEAKGLHRVHRRDGSTGMRVKATGGGAYRYADLFRERLGVVLEKEDEMSCLVAGCTFLLRAITHEAFTFENGAPQFIPTNQDADLYPYLLVNIGSGVSMLRVTGPNQYERVSGSSLGGGTFWGLCRLLTGLQDFDEMLALSMQGDNANVDMLVGDIYGGRDYTSIGLSATTIASSFGKVISQDKDLSDYSRADISMALCRMVSYNIGQLAYLNAMRYSIKRIFFGGFFIRGHPYTMETISYAIRFWSKGDMAALFLRHEGFLGAVGAFLLVHPTISQGISGPQSGTYVSQPGKVRARFVERFSTGAPLTGGQVVGPAIGDLQGKVSWVEKFVALGALQEASSGPVSQQGSVLGDAAQQPDTSSVEEGAGSLTPGDEPLQQQQQDEGAQVQPAGVRRSATAGADLTSLHRASGASSLQRTLTCEHPASPSVRMALHVGVLHYSPGYDVFPLLEDPASYEPNTITPADGEMRWWIQLLQDQIPTVVRKASGSEGNTEEAERRGAAFGRALGAHMEKLKHEPGAYGAWGLMELFELREECLREFGFPDVYKKDKDRENQVALQVLPDLLADIDCHAAGQDRWLVLIEGALASNIFDWGASACVAMYQNGTILDIYREARSRLSKRPWALDDFDKLHAHLSARGQPPYRRVMMFVDNAGADVVLGQIPIAREFLRLGCEVVMVANQQPAINDITAAELNQVLDTTALYCPIVKQAREAAANVLSKTGGSVPAITNANQQEPTVAKLFVLENGQGSPCMNLRRVPAALAEASIGTELVIIEGMGRAIHTNFNASFKCDSLLLAMIKTERLAKHLFGDSGALYDCICKFNAAKV